MSRPSVADNLWPDGSLHPNDYFCRILCLNLDRRPDRWQRMAQELAHWQLDVLRMPAVDGREDTVKHAHESQGAGKSERSCMEYACRQSYLGIFQQAQSENWERLLILEDDACFHRLFPALFQHVREVPPGWRLLYLGCSQHNWQSIQTTTGPFYAARRSLGTFAFAASRRAYAGIIRRVKESARPIDECLAAIQHRHRHQCWVLSPNLMIADVHDSDIRESRPQQLHAERMRWTLSDYRLPCSRTQAEGSQHSLTGEGDSDPTRRRHVTAQG